MTDLLGSARFLGNPLVQFISVVVTVVLAVGAVLLGAIMLSLFLGVVAFVGFYLYVRLWWLRRRWAKQVYRSGPPNEEFVEAEYKVLGERSSREP